MVLFTALAFLHPVVFILSRTVGGAAVCRTQGDTAVLMGEFVMNPVQDSVASNKASSSRKALAVAAVIVGAVGISAGAAATTPANAAVGMYHVTSNWWQAFASLEGTGGPGYFQAKALLGSTVRWGAYSWYQTHAQVDGYSWDHNAWLFMNGNVWKSAQGW